MNHVYFLSNSRTAAVTVNAQTVPANHVKRLIIDDATTDLVGFVAGGCCVVSAEISDVLNTAAQYAENSSRQLSTNVRALASAGLDPRAASGI